MPQRHQAHCSLTKVALMNRLKFAWPATVMVLVTATLLGCTQEQQNKIGREIQNWTGTNGVLEIYAGDKLVRLKVWAQVLEQEH